MKIVFCVPGRKFSGHFLKSWSKLINELQSMEIEWELINLYHPIVYQARQKCLNRALEIDYDYIAEIEAGKADGYDPSLGEMSFSDGSFINIEADYLLLAIDEKNSPFANDNFDIEVYGGINFSNFKEVLNAGANILVSGTTIFKENNGNIKKNIETLRSI